MNPNESVYSYTLPEEPDTSKMTPRELHQRMLSQHKEARSLRRQRHRESRSYRKIIPILH